MVFTPANYLFGDKYNYTDALKEQVESYDKFANTIEKYNTAVQKRDELDNLINVEKKNTPKNNKALQQAKLEVEELGKQYKELKLLGGNTADKDELLKEFTSSANIHKLTKTRSGIKAICTQYDEYNKDIATGGKVGEKAANSQEKMLEIISATNPELEKALKNNENSAKAYKAYRTEQAQATVATIAQTVAQTALNMAISAGVSMLVGVVINAMTSFVDAMILTKEEAMELAEEIKTKFNEINDTLKANQAVVDENSKKYAKLSKGVDSFGKNVSLTNEEFEEYNSISNAIGEQFPTLISGYTDTGNAILACKDNVQLLNEELERQKKLAQDELVVNSNQALEAYNTLYAKDDSDFWSIASGIYKATQTIGALPLAPIRIATGAVKDENLATTFALNSEAYESSKSTIDMYKDLDSVFKDNTLTIEERTNALDKMLNTEYVGVGNDYLKLKSLLEEAGVTVDGILTFNGLVEEALKTNNVGALQSYYNTLSDTINQANAELLSQVVMPNLQYNVAYSSTYDLLTDDEKGIAQTLIQNLDENTLLSFGDDTTAMMDWIKTNIINPINDSSTGVKTAFDDLLSLNDKIDTIGYSEYLTKLNEYLTKIAEGIGGEAGQTIADNIREGMNVDVEQYRKTIDSLWKDTIDYTSYDNARLYIDENNQAVYGTLEEYDKDLKLAVVDELKKLSQEELYTFQANVEPEFEFTDTNPEVISSQIQEVIANAQATEIQKQGFKFSDYSDEYESIQEQIEKYRTAYESITDDMTNTEKLNLLNDMPELQPYINDTEALKNKLQELSVISVNSLIDSLYDLQSRITNPQVKAEIQEYIDLLSGMGIESTYIDKSFTDVITEVSNVRTAINDVNSDLENTGRISGETLSTISDLSSELETAVISYLNKDITIDELIKKVQDYYTQAKADNAEYVMSVSQDLVEYALKFYNVDISNCATYAEAKNRILASINNRKLTDSNGEVLTDGNGEELTLSDMYNAETGEYTDLYQSYAKSTGEFSKAIIECVHRYVELIKTGIGEVELGIDDIDWENILDKFDNTANEALRKIQDELNELNHKRAMGLISQADYNDVYNSLTTAALGIDKSTLNDSELQTVQGMEETNYSNYQSSYQNEYAKEKSDLENAYSDKLKTGREYYDELERLNEEYYGENGKINDIDGTTYEDNLRDLTVNQRASLYDDEIANIQKDYEDGIIGTIADLENALAESATYWLEGYPELEEKLNTATEEATTYLYEQSRDILDRQREQGLISTTDYTRKLKQVWETYYKDKDNLRQEDYEAEQAVISSARDSVSEQIDGLQSIIDKNTELADSQIEALEEQKELIEEQYDTLISQKEEEIELIEDKADEEDRYLNILKAEAELRRALSQKTVGVMDANGVIQYVADPNAVREAEENYRNALNESAVDVKTKEKEELEEQRDSQTEIIDELITAINDDTENKNEPYELLIEALSSLIADKFDIDYDFLTELLQSEDAQRIINNRNAELIEQGKDPYVEKVLEKYVEVADESLNAEGTLVEQNEEILTALERADMNKISDFTPQVDTTSKENEQTKSDITSDSWKYTALMNTPIPTTFTDSVLSAITPAVNTYQDITNQNNNNNYSFGDIVINNPIGNSNDLANELIQNFGSAIDRQIYTVRR